MSIPRIERLLATLIRIPSPSGEEEQVLGFIERFLKRASISFRRQYVSRKRYNLIAEIGTSNSKAVLFNTHVDTVPAYTDAQLRPRRRGDRLYGRGACDAKGSVAAMLLAFHWFSRVCKYERPRVTLGLMVGEENSGDGVENFVSLANQYQWAVVGEPTDLMIANTQSGYIQLIIEACSRAGHGFEPIGDQSIIAVAETLKRINAYLKRCNTQGTCMFVRWVRGGTEDTFWYTRPSCKASILINTFPDSQRQRLLTDIRHVAHSVQLSLKRTHLHVKLSEWDNGVATPKHSKPVKCLRLGIEATGVEPKLTHLPSWTDGSALAAIGVPTVIFGPGTLKDAHTGRERVSLSDVRNAARALAIAAMTATLQP